MKTTKFAHYLNKFFTSFLPSTNGCTPQTIDSYRYAFMLFLDFMAAKGTAANSVEVTDLTRRNVSGFLDWLQVGRGNSVPTRNQRQAALNSFVKYLMYEFPDYLSEYQAILSLPIKKAPQKEISYLKTEGVKLLLSQARTGSASGMRDYAILTLMYTTGIRVSELTNIKVKDLNLQAPPTLLVHGKGQKSRYVPLIGETVGILGEYVQGCGLDQERSLDSWLFKNHMGEQFQRQGVNYLIKKYGDLARAEQPNLIPKDLSPHKMRHSTAMGLVDSGVDLIYIRDLLGHVSVKTTEVYAKADAAKKREAIEAASKDIVPHEQAQWDSNSGLREWLKTFNRA